MTSVPNGINGLFVGALDNCLGLFRRERRDGILKLREFVGNVGRQQVAPCRDRLPELDENRSKLLEGEPDSLSERCGRVPPSRCKAEQESQRTQQVRFLDDVVEPVLHEHALNCDQAKYGTATGHVSPCH
jgi:hypothetical protein